MTPTNLLIMIALAMLFIEILLITWLGLYVAKLHAKTAADDAALFLQGRRIQDVTKEMLELLKAG